MTRKTLWLEVTLIVALSLLVRVADVDHDPIHDELYHLLAAQSWVAEGSFDVGDGQYRRGAIYTMFVGAIYSVLGQDIASVRMASAGLGALWVGLVFLWCRKKFSPSTAWIASLLFCFAPGAIFLSQYIRFYAMHGVLFWIGAAAVYEIIEQTRSRSVNLLLLAVSAICFGLALDLQVTTAIGVAGIFAYAFIRWLPTLWEVATRSRRARMVSLAVFGIGLVAVVVFVNTPPFRALLNDYTSAPLWASGSGPLRYHWMFVYSAPVFWGLLPVAVLLVVSRRCWPGIYCATIFSVAFVCHSFAGVKGERYIYYAMPYFFILSGFLTGEILTFTRRIMLNFATDLKLFPPARRLMPVAGVAVVLAGLVLSNPAARITADMLRGKDTRGKGGSNVYWSRYESDWDDASADIRELANHADILITSQGLHLLYYVGDYDIELSSTRLSDLYLGNWDKAKDFTMDFRTGRPVVSSVEGVRQVFACNDSGLIVVRDRAWRNSAYVDDDVADYIERHAQRVELPERYGLTVFKWASQDTAERPACVEPLARRPAEGN